MDERSRRWMRYARHTAGRGAAALLGDRGMTTFMITQTSTRRSSSPTRSFDDQAVPARCWRNRRKIRSEGSRPHRSAPPSLLLCARNHIVDFLVARSKSFAPMTDHDPRHVPTYGPVSRTHHRLAAARRRIQPAQSAAR